MKTEEIKIKVQGQDGQPCYEPVQAFIVGALAVHRATRLNRAGVTEASGAWTITHIQSGLCVCKWLKLRKNALTLAEAMGTVLDWTQSPDVLKQATPEVKEGLLALAAQYGGVLQ